ncbi:MAG: hypothetical protein NC223_06780, partial [Butyrivibrio sp.]|nr:hypothetical protein [Butyrivibrio sp.]
MGFFKNKIIYTVVALLVSLSLVAYSFGFYSVQAAEVSTLPADIDITASYDADNVYWTYSDKDYSFSRSYPLTVEVDGRTMYFDQMYTEYSDSCSFTVRDYKTSDFSVPTVESFNGVHYNASYWFSPSENALYVLRTQGSGVDIKNNAGFIRSYSVDNSNRGTFGFWTAITSTWYHLPVYRYDFDSESMTIADYTINVYRSTTLSSTSFCWHFDFGGGFSLVSSSDSVDVYACNDRTRIQMFFPSDLLCLYSSYAISGFYEPDTSKVVTPDYYFNYQYIFYLKDFGYTFVDSAEKLLEIGFPNSVITARYFFAKKGNFYIYTSVDGISWNQLTTYSTMYADTFDVDYKRSAAGLYELVYTNDNDFGVSIKEWESLPDVIGDLEDLIPVLDYYHSDYYYDTGFDYDKYNTITYWARYVDQLAYQLDVSLTGSALSDWFFHNRYNNSDSPSSFSDYIYLFLLTELSSDYIIDYNTRGGESGTLTLYGLVRRLNNLSENTNVYLDKILNQIHSDFIGVNDNLSLLYDLDSKLLSSVKEIKIPDHTAAIDKTLLKLDTL